MTRAFLQQPQRAAELRFGGLNLRARTEQVGGLPIGGGDLTHHLLLVDYLERHWRLVHDPSVEAYLGEMVHYTPGVHLLIALAGRWFASDGLHMTHAVVALSLPAVAAAAPFTSFTMAAGVRSGPDGRRSGVRRPVASSLTCDPPTSITRMRMGGV